MLIFYQAHITEKNAGAKERTRVVVHNLMNLQS